MLRFFDFIKEMLESHERIDAAQVERLTAEANRYLSSLEELAKSGDPEKALRDATELKKYLETKINTLET